MIKLYREDTSPQADLIEAELNEMLFGYDREVITPAEAKERFGDEHVLPIMTNNEKVVSGDLLPAYMNELKDLMRDWQAFQGDWCYVNDKGENC